MGKKLNAGFVGIYANKLREARHRVDFLSKTPLYDDKSGDEEIEKLLLDAKKNLAVVSAILQDKLDNDGGIILEPIK